MNSKGRLLRALIAVACLAAPAATVGGPAGADEAHPDAAAIAAHLGISEAEANERLSVENVVGSMNADAQRLWPDTFAGLWIDHEAGGRVLVAFTSDAAGKVAELKRGFSRPDLLQPVTVPRSLPELEAVQSRMVADREQARAGRLSFPGVPGGAYDLDIDLRRNVVVAIVDESDPRTAGAFAARYGEHVVVEATGIAAPETCYRTDCRYSLRAGIRAESATSWCSTAFAVSSGILSAGHCSDSSRYHDGEYYGYVTAQQQSGRVDAERHSVSSGGFYAGPWIYLSSSEQARDVTSTGLWANLSIGASVCKTGVTTGTTCGTVLSTTYSPSYVPNSERFVKTSYCSDSGDSGGGVYSGNRALGIHSGGSTLACSNADDFAIFGHIEYAQNALNVTVRTSETAPSFSSISAAAASTSITARFSKPVRCATVSASDFTANLNGTVTLTVTSASCSADSNSTVILTVNIAPAPATTVNVRLVGSVQNPGGDTVAAATRSDTV